MLEILELLFRQGREGHRVPKAILAVRVQGFRLERLLDPSFNGWDIDLNVDLYLITLGSRRLRGLIQSRNFGIILERCHQNRIFTDGFGSFFLVGIIGRNEIHASNIGLNLGKIFLILHVLFNQ